MTTYSFEVIFRDGSVMQAHEQGVNIADARQGVWLRFADAIKVCPI